MKVPRDEYMNLYRRFNPVKWDPDALLQLATAAGMKYVVFVTKHHDGFTMWSTGQKRFLEGGLSWSTTASPTRPTAKTWSA
ncbi:MAG: alpha-L-fucosidase [Kiritimatiellia bacterium]